MTIIGIVEQSLRAHVYLNLPLDMPARSKALVAYLVKACVALVRVVRTQFV